MTKISFILPAYKRLYLAEAIRSILVQTFVDFELVVVDDCSPENLREVVAEFSDARLRYVRNEQNVGGKNLVAAWNKAMLYAQSEWCVLASDDDVYMPTYAEKMLSLAEKFQNVDVLHCRTGFINDSGRLYKVGEARPEFESCADLMYARGIKRCAQTAPEFIFRTSALRKQGGFVPFPAAWYSDDATWAALAKKHGIACNPEVLFHWRFSGVNISARRDVIKMKVIAAEEYKKWLSVFLEDVPCNQTNDQLVWEFVKQHIYEIVDQQTLFDLNDSCFGDWFRLMIKQPLPRRLKLRAIRNRIRGAIGLG